MSAQLGPTDEPAPQVDGVVDRGAAAQAQVLHQQGLAYARKKQWDEAAETFRVALKLHRSEATAFELAEALTELGRLGEVVDLLAPIAEAGASEKLRKAAARRWDALQDRVGHISVEVEGEASTEGLTLRLNQRGGILDWRGRLFPVPIGEVDVALERRKRRVVGMPVLVAAGSEPLVVTLDLPSAEHQQELLAAASASDDGPASGGEPGSRLASPREAAETLADDQAPPLGNPYVGRKDDGGVTSRWWFWTASAGVAVGAAILVAAVVASAGDSRTSYLEGDSGVVVARVTP